MKNHLLIEYGIKFKYKRWEHIKSKFKKNDKNKKIEKGEFLQNSYEDFVSLELKDGKKFSDKIELGKIEQKFFTIFNPALKMELKKIVVGQELIYKIHFSFIYGKGVFSIAEILAEDAEMACDLLGKEQQLKRSFNEELAIEETRNIYVEKVSQLPRTINETKAVKELNEKINRYIQQKGRVENGI